METIQIPAANEVVSALLAKKCVDDKALLAAIKSDPAKALNMRDTTVRVRAVQNTRDLLHVCVPDYEAIQELDSSELEQVSGGLSRRPPEAAAMIHAALQRYSQAAQAVVSS